MNSNAVYQIVTDKLIEAMEKGVIPWSKPWAGGASAPTNLFSKRHYRGLNVMLLGLRMMDEGWESPYFVTLRQANQLGGRIKAGSHGEEIVYYKRLVIEERDAVTGEKSKRTIPFLRYSTVFNVAAQTEGLADKLPKIERREIGSIEAADAVVAGMPKRPEIKHGGDRACYSPLCDEVMMPPRDTFKSAPLYYGVLFHELSHATGHASRVGRKSISEIVGHSWGDESYGMEELVAEMGAAFVGAEIGLECPIEHSAGYLQSWIKTLKGDVRLAVKAASQAQKAADWIMGRYESPKDDAPAE